MTESYVPSTEGEYGPGNGVTSSASSLRTVILREAEEAIGRISGAASSQIGPVLRGMSEAMPLQEVTAIAPETLANWAASLFDLAQRRRPGELVLRLTPSSRGAGSGGAIVEIVTDDMPFLVDSVLATLSLVGQRVKRLLHPVFQIRRDADGRLEEVSCVESAQAPDDVAAGGAESLMWIEIMPQGLQATPPADWPAVEAALRQAMTEVRIAVTDTAAMLARLREAEGEILQAPEGKEAIAFLRWLADDNFVLLGYRLIRLPENGVVAADESLGLLRDPAVVAFDALRQLPAVPESIWATLVQPVPITVAKSNLRVRVHRPSYADVVVTRVFGPAGQVTAVRLFLGLFAPAAYNRNPRSIPWLAPKVARILEASGTQPDSHNGRTFRSILDTWPRDELFQADEVDLVEGGRLALDLAIRPRPAVVLRRDSFGRFVSAIVWLPRESYDTRLRMRVGRILAAACNGWLSAFSISVSDAPLARVHYVIGTRPDDTAPIDKAALDAAISCAARGFPEALIETLLAQFGEEEGTQLATRWSGAFPAAYPEFSSPMEGVADLQLAEAALSAGKPVAALAHGLGRGRRRLLVRLASPGDKLALADVLPYFKSLGLRAIEEQPWQLSPAGSTPVALHVYTVEAELDLPEDRLGDLHEALSALLEGRTEADGFNRLVACAGIGWREAWLIRAIFRWCKQVGFAFPQPAVEAALVAHAGLAGCLVTLFRTRLDPDIVEREAALVLAESRWTTLMEDVADADAERILLRLRVAVDAVTRTNFFLGKDYLCLKIDSTMAGRMPEPRPWREIFVSDMRMEGVHLRTSPVARGGIRWSDRREDFRTEILGLMKAQHLKNAIIVPTGAKGGFVLKGTVPPASDRAAFLAAGVAAYRILICAMLDVADNLGPDGKVLPPERVVCRDGEDPYIVAAADKGTATFSDIANALSVERGFWLDDAFASGGSAGYDHKALGITARGAWVMVARHFAEKGRDIQKEAFTCVGVGDMSGDVFGNGVLISRKTKLVAAFDHRHIFIDPHPDTDASFEERQRLFALPASSWDDYDRKLISAGGGVFPRSARTIALSREARELLGLQDEHAEPVAIMRAILKMDVDLLYFGGIGTYVKATSESQMDAGDRANDALRIDARELRAKVIGEGANLAITQAGRIEAARAGIALDTDSLDNSAGVSTSDHEVNIKVLLAAAERSGELTRPQRNALLAAMTDEVAELVLADNAAQFLALSMELAAGPDALMGQAALMSRLEDAGLLDRTVLGLPSARGMVERARGGDALTRPEIAALLPVTKLWLKDELQKEAATDDPAFLPMLRAYFPLALQERFPGLIDKHPLRRNLVATILANSIVNRIGPACLSRLAEEASPVVVVKSVWMADQLFGISDAADAVDLADLSSAEKLAALVAMRDLHEDAARALLKDRDTPLSELEDALRPGIRLLLGAVTVKEGRLPEAAGRLVTGAPALSAAISLVRVAASVGVAPAEAAASWDALGRDAGLDVLRTAVLAAPAPGAFGPRARVALLEDLETLQIRLTRAVLRGQSAGPAEDAIRLAREAAGQCDLTAAAVALRALEHSLPGV